MKWTIDVADKREVFDRFCGHLWYVIQDAEQMGLR